MNTEATDNIPASRAPLPSTAAAGESGPARVLCVDDEPDVLASLRRVLKNGGYSEPIDLVISDMRMPQMDGVRFLGQVQEQWPQTMRILLSSQADAELIAEAVNSGLIYRYFAKPWDDDDIVLQVRLALERRAFEQEKARKEQIALARTEELKALNASLEQNVSASQDELAQANRRLKNNFIISLKVFASLIETRRKHMVGHARRVADLARKLASRLDLEPALVQEVFVAGLLHDIGKLAFPDGLLDTPVASMSSRQLHEYRQHPARAEELLMPLQDLRGAAASIGAQMERFDGTGFPRQLSGRAILVGARILAVCSDYDNLQIGLLAPRLFTPREALGVIERSSGKRYDPWVVDAFSAMLRGKPGKASVEKDESDVIEAPEPADLDDLLIDAADVVAGMVLSRDLISPGGLMMLPSGHTINDRLITKMHEFEKADNEKLTIYIKKPVADT